MIGAAASSDRAESNWDAERNMPTLEPMVNLEVEEERDETVTFEIVRCYIDPTVRFIKTSAPLSGERLLTAQALRLLLILNAELREARADWNQDRFRRIMQARSQARVRVLRRWSRLNPPPSVLLGTLCRRYNANLAGYLYQVKA